MRFGLYYQAEVDPKRTWFFAATLRSFEHVVFDRTLDKTKGLFEFFVPHDMQDSFLHIMQYFIDKKIIWGLQELPNRLDQ